MGGNENLKRRRDGGIERETGPSASRPRLRAEALGSVRRRARWAPAGERNGPGSRPKRQVQGARDMRRTREENNGSKTAAAAGAPGARPAPRCGTVRAGLPRKALSVVLAALLVATMNPLANDAAALAQAADGAREALGAPASGGAAQESADGAAAPGEGPGGGCLQLT